LEQFLAGKSGTAKDYSFSLEVGSESELLLLQSAVALRRLQQQRQQGTVMNQERVEWNPREKD
jgi:hypothetical protein